MIEIDTRPDLELQRRRIARAHAEGTRASDQADRLRRRAIAMQVELSEAEDDHRSMLERSTVITAVMVAAVGAGLLAYLVLDYAGLGAMSDYLAGLAFPDWRAAYVTARLLFPVAYGALDIFVGIMLDASRDSQDRTGRGLVLGFRVLAATLLLAPVAFVVATHRADALVAAQDGGADLSEIFAWKLVGMTVLSFVPHAAMVLGSMWIREAWAYTRLHGRLTRLREAVAALEAECRNAELAATEAFIRYVHLWTTLQGHTESGKEIPFGPFHDVYSELVKRRFGKPPSPELGFMHNVGPGPRRPQ